MYNNSSKHDAIISVIQYVACKADLVLVKSYDVYCVVVGCVKVLMDWGMDPNLCRKGQVTPLMDACAGDHLE